MLIVLVNTLSFRRVTKKEGVNYDSTKSSVLIKLPDMSMDNLKETRKSRDLKLGPTSRDFNLSFTFFILSGSLKKW